MDDTLPQRTVSVPFPVIQGVTPIAAHHGLERLANIIRREKIGIPNAAGKADQLWRMPSITLKRGWFPRGNLFLRSYALLPERPGLI